jgi:ACS family hexuronate transporter-like MFS transporter
VSGSAAASAAAPNGAAIGRYRWWIGGLLFASTVINYLDRQTLSVLGPTLKTDFRWSNQDFALVIVPFRGGAERAMILSDRAAEMAEAPQDHGRPVAWSELLSLRQTWGVIAARGLTDPVWYMIADWFAIYLASKGFSLEQTAAGFWVPFLAADLGNFFGGGLSSHLIRRGWPVGRARKALLLGGAVGVLALVPAAFLSAFPALVTCFAVATFSYAAMSTMALSFPADLYQHRAVATVSGLSGTGAGIGTIASTFLIGVVAGRLSFTPILVVASLVPLAAAVLVILLVRNTAESGRGVLKVV